MHKEEILKLEERFQKTVYGNTMMMKYLGFTLGRINLSKEEIQEVMDYLIDKEEYEFCNKLQKYTNMTKPDTS
jgi:CRISPR/Cas system CSM-associated protein Csm2 small subunit